MKKVLVFLFSSVAMATTAQTLHVVQEGVDYQIPSAQAGDMTFVGGTSVEIMGRTFTLADVTGMYVDDTPVADNTVSVVYEDDAAMVYVSGNVARYVDVSVSGAHVTLTQSDDLDDTTGKIEYILTGSSTNGSFTMNGSYKMDLTLEALSLTNPSGAAIDIENGKKINVTVKKGTENTLTDGANGNQKACFVLKGHAEFKGQGTLNVYGNAAHGIKTGDFMTMKNCTVNILKATKDGIHANEYFLLESGTLTISGVGDDGIQAELDGTSSTGETTDHEDEDTGNIYIDGGTLTIMVTKAGTKCIKSDATVRISGGDLTLTASGAIDTSDSSDYSYTAGVKAADVVIDGGAIDITVTSSGTAGRGISADQSITTNGGTLTITNSGAGQTATNDTYTAKGLKADSSIKLNAGIIIINMSGTGGKGIKSAGTYTQGLSDGSGPTLTVNTTGSKLGSSGGGGGFVRCRQSGCF